uniref:C-type lectin domain-containing protein n=1 Tax=Amphilophus citrinellus TaxID=61819 RepID=A0A3Q0RCA2_AMPCI
LSQKNLHRIFSFSSSLQRIITMDMLLRIFVFLCISVGFLFVPGRSEACPRNTFTAGCEFVFGNVCLEFVEELKTWSQARSSCEKQGGELLMVKNSSVQVFLKNITREWKTSFNHTWWLGETVGEDNQKSTISDLLFNDGKNDIKVGNLTEMIAVQSTYCFLYEASAADVLTLQCLAVVVVLKNTEQINKSKYIHKM